jgi:hypothetical protein
MLRKGTNNLLANFEVNPDGGDNYYHQTEWNRMHFRIVMTGAGTFNLVNQRITSGKIICVDWGDGTRELYTGTGALQTLTHAYAGAGTYIGNISGDLAEWYVFYMTTSLFWFDVKELAKLTGLKQLTISTGGNNAYGDMSYLHGTPLTRLFISAPQLTGDLAPFFFYDDLDYVLAGEGNYFCEITNIPSALASLLSTNTDVYCDLSLLTGETTLTDLRLNSDSVTGDLSDLSGETQYVRLRLTSNQVTGDLADLAPLVNIAATLTISNNGSQSITYTTTTLPTRNSVDEDYTGLVLTTPMVDQYLIDSADAGKTGGSINIAGTNAARSGFSDAAVATLTGNGVTVTANTDADTSFFKIVTTGAEQAALRVKLTSSQSVVIYWGDGDSDEIVGTGADQNLTHNYAGAGTWHCTVTGDLDDVLEWYYSDAKILSSTSEVTKFTNLEIITDTGADALYGLMSDIYDVRATLESITLVNQSNFTGDSSTLADLTALTYLNINTTGITVDLADIAGLSSLTYMRLNGHTGSFTDTALPALNGVNEYVHDLGLSGTEVDNYLIRKAAAGKTGGVVYIAGTNAARSSASDAAVTTLTGNGVTVTAN